MSTPVPANELDVLAFAREKRVMIVNAILPSEVAITSADPKMLKLALSALDGLDRQELGIQKIDADTKGAAADRMVAEALTSLLTVGLAGRNPFEAGGGGNVPEARSTVPGTVDVGSLVMVPGETQVGLSTDNLMTFAERTGLRTDTIAGADGSATGSEYDTES